MNRFINVVGRSALNRGIIGGVRPSSLLSSSSLVSSVQSSTTGITTLLPNLANESLSYQTRNIWVFGKDAVSKDYVDPNAPTTYQIKTIYGMDRVVKGRAGVKRLRFNGYVPATITGGGLPLRNIVVEWGRIYGLTKTSNFYKNRKYVLNMNENEKVVVRLAHVEAHAVSERALFIKFVRTNDDPATIESDTLPHITYQQALDKIKQERIQKKRDFQQLLKIDLTFKPAIRKSATA
ncbi:hypothetical protein PPL_01063 [Heterostelium album PN500]|uniref:Large ribosomal subunit protein bL25 L25 domain-containing protein n=1 Tax=Heterostelium pallidum (strain ATCC 26659 / Pp 5 / PN500) TaxID=670386 RepID=D3AY05_HETP5|nr:hypothetical protein PPL_01063 [Heterostelium album PN500]EFA85832.1 hypothetical protein PPL_01063 [Heterostelium album PN500]|eukprot:XP_020437938.1 hypothetical protein PPL_01063 [Heterostelium album PN500]